MAKNSAFIMVVCVAGLVAVGMVMLFSAGAYAHDNRGDMYYFLTKQAQWLAIGLVACVTAAIVDYHIWVRLRWPLFGLAALMLVLCFVPHIGQKINGSYRWVRLGPLTVQPSELAKFAAIIALAWWFCKHEAQSRSFWRGFAMPLALVGVLMVLIVKEEDLGTTTLIGATSVIIMFIAGCNSLYLMIMAAGGAGGIWLIAMKMPERMARLTAFRHPDLFLDGANFQQNEAAKAFGSGGIYGVGLGGSIEKMKYLPYAHTEFIFPIIGEELGLRATLLIVSAFLLVTMCGVLISMQSRDRFGMLLGMGLVMSIALQASVNIGMTTWLLPNKGMSLPFISSGGSNLCLCLLFVGILINIYRQGQLTAVGAGVAATRLQARITPRI